MKTSMIITYYYVDDSTVDMTLRCLNSLEFGRPDEVILVNDGSKVSKELLEYPGIRYIQRPENGGFAACVNTGLDAASNEVIIICNNDIELSPGWLEAITEPLTQGYSISSIRTTDQTGYDTEDVTTEGDNFGSIWAMTRTAYELIGKMDESLGKGYFEDQDYKQRALSLGLKIAKNHRVAVEHVGKATFSKIDPEDEHFRAGMQRYKDKYGRVD